MKKFVKDLKIELRRNGTLYFMVIPVIVYYFMFAYKPLYGALIAFQDYNPARGFGEDWAGFKHFLRFFNSPYLGRLIKNTIAISGLNLLFGFPIPIILALLMNEVRNKRFKAVSQSLMNLPHFISLVAICGIVKQFCLSDGLFNDLIEMFGGERIPLLQHAEYYWLIYIGSGIWQEFGWSSVIYLAALSGVDTQLYEAAAIDGAGRWKQTLHVTLPAITPTIVITLILRIGRLMSLDYEKSLLLYNEAIYETADIISTYTYRSGLLNREWSYSTAVGLFNSVVNITLVTVANKVSKKVTDSSLW